MSGCRLSHLRCRKFACSLHTASAASQWTLRAGPPVQIMLQDLVNVRLAAGFLRQVELTFDLLSALDELAAQIKLEYDFQREARIMDTIANHLKVGCRL